jgi:hypothetical protein
VIPHRNMADDRDPPSLFNNVEIEHRDDDDNDDLFTSAIESVNFLLNQCNCVALTFAAAVVTCQKLHICDKTFWKMTDFNAVSRLTRYQFQMQIAIFSNMCRVLQQK